MLDEYSDNLFNILSNITCIFPIILFIIDKNYYDSILILNTGIFSFLYHLNNNEPNVLSTYIFDDHAIRVVDVCFSEMLVLTIATYVIFYKNYYIRSVLLNIYFPINIYLVCSDNISRTYILYSFITLCVLSKIIILYKLNKLFSKISCCLFIGLLLNSVQILLYQYLQRVYPIEYNFYHGFHHIFAFLSIILYFLSSKDFSFKKPYILNITREYIINNNDEHL